LKHIKLGFGVIYRRIPDGRYKEAAAGIFRIFLEARGMCKLKTICLALSLAIYRGTTERIMFQHSKFLNIWSRVGPGVVCGRWRDVPSSYNNVKASLVANGLTYTVEVSMHIQAGSRFAVYNVSDLQPTKYPVAYFMHSH
jgi:hypothetical protein